MRDVAIYIRCITAFSRLPLTGAVYYIEYIYNFSDYFSKENRFEFGYTLVEIIQMYTLHDLPHRAQVDSK